MHGLIFNSGEVIGERYRLSSKLGEGGMGEVWRAEHVALKSPVAIKFINPSVAANDSAVNRFMLEARSCAALRSTHIVQVFDFGVHQGAPYIAMELLNGESLAACLARERALSVQDTCRIMSEVARAVQYAHEAGVVHRDLKPDNIFLVNEGATRITKVLDFGIAKVVGGSLEVTTGGGTQTGAVMGTPFYVSPEQALGDKQIDFRTDLWALGVITYECLVGAPPFVSEGLGSLIMKICNQPHQAPSERAAVPDELDAWMAQALAKDPSSRFQSAVPMFEALSALVRRAPSSGASPATSGGSPPTAATGARVTTDGVAASWPSEPGDRGSRKIAWAVGGVAALALASGGGWWLMSRSSGPVGAAGSTVPSAMAAAPAAPSEPSASSDQPSVPEAQVTPAKPAASDVQPEARQAPVEDDRQKISKPRPRLPRKKPARKAAPPASPAAVGSKPAKSGKAVRSSKVRTKASLFEDRK